MIESLFCDIEQMAVMMGTYYAMDRMSRMKGEGKQTNPCQGKRCIIWAQKDVNISALNSRVNHFLAGGRGGLIVNTASAAGLVFNQVG